MKYIRTKDGRILKVFKDNVGLVSKNDGLTYYKEDTIDFETSYWLPKSEIAKQADTIEELCDAQVVVINDKYHHIVYPDGLGYYYRKEDKIEEFGAIWTDKGLIYVAKLNDKGELELL